MTDFILPRAAILSNLIKPMITHQVNPPLLRRHWSVNKHNEVIMKARRNSRVDYVALFKNFIEQGMPQLAEEAFLDLSSQEEFDCDVDIISELMLCYAQNGLLCKARVIWDEMLARSIPPFNVEVISRLFNVYCNLGLFVEVTESVDELLLNGFDNLFPAVYVSSVVCLGSRGEVELMERMVRRMVSQGYAIDSKTGSAFVKCYSLHGSLKEMENAYAFLKRSRCLLDEDGIRAIAIAYIKEKKFYNMGEFLKDVGLGRRNVGNLMWNLLLLSYAADFKMKSLQREFLKMLDAGFCPDITTFNIRMLAFCKMSLFWDLHLSLEHMKTEKVDPDLVTYGCIVDAYVSRRLGRNLDFPLAKMQRQQSPSIKTDLIVFDVLGKGDFHMHAESFLEYNSGKKWKYSDLISIYLKKQYRNNQIFWNY